MSALEPFFLTGLDGKRYRGDRTFGNGRQILFVTGFLSKRWGNKSKALAQWCEEEGWGFCCYDVRGFGESEGRFTDYTLSDWIDDARNVLTMLTDSQHITRPSQVSHLLSRACLIRLLSRGTRPFPRSRSSAIRSEAGSPGSWRRSFSKLSV